MRKTKISKANTTLSSAPKGLEMLDKIPSKSCGVTLAVRMSYNIQMPSIIRHNPDLDYSI
eukprot:11858758-Ditylum_brightwellii.AAC.1